MKIKRKILFRADGDSVTGLGHLYRCIALIEMLKKNYECFFLTRKYSLLEVIPEDYNVNLIPENILHSEEPNWIYENYSSDDFIIIADGYQFSSNYQKKIKDFSFDLVYIDDLATEKMFADIVINHSLNVNDFISAEYTKFALGPKYALLRPKFINASKKSREIKQISEVLICFGGSDVFDITNTVLEGIIEIEEINKIHIVLGAAYMHEKIYKTLKRKKENIFIYKNIQEQEMLDLMYRCQLAIVPSSTISYEVCSVKMIVLSGYCIDNQKRMYEGLNFNKLIYSGGDFNKLNAIDIKQKVSEIINDSPLNYKELIKNQSKIFDGNQIERFNNLIKSIC